MAEKIIRFGIIGPGGIAHKFANAVKCCDEAVVTAIASRNPERGAAFAEEFGIETVYSDYETLAKDPNVDAIYVAVPHNFHAEHCIMAMRHKKAILCEKPCAVSLAQAQQMVAVAKEENVLFMEALWTRFLPAIQKAHEWIADGKIGDVKLIEASFAFRREPGPDDRLYNRALAGGCILDVGVYSIGFALDFAKSPVKKFHGLAQVGETGVDEVAAVQMQFENGILSSCSNGVAVKARDTGCIYGTKGMVQVSNFWATKDAALYDNAGNLLEVIHDDEQNGFCYEVKHFAKLWREGQVESPRMPWKDTVQAATVYGGLLEEWGLAYA